MSNHHEELKLASLKYNLIFKLILNILILYEEVNVTSSDNLRLTET